MNKKFLSAILFGALMVSSTGTFGAIKVSFFIHFYRKDLSLHKNPIDIYEKRRHK